MCVAQEASAQCAWSPLDNISLLWLEAAVSRSPEKLLTPSLLLSSSPEIEIGAGTHCIPAVMGPRIGKSRQSKEGALGGSLGIMFLVWKV